MKNIVFAALFISILLTGCIQEGPANGQTTDQDSNGEPIIGGDTDEHGCLIAAGYSWCEAKEECLRQWEDPCEAVFTHEQAYAYVQGSWDCTKEGNILDEYIYNNETRTWWFETDIEKEGCNPACVVYEDTGLIELNWRCTGLVEPGTETQE